MKFFEILGLLSVINACMASPLDYRWNLIANDDGKMHLVDVNPIEIDPEPFFNAETDTRFLLFTGFNPTVGQRVTWTVDSIHASRFNPVNPVRMIVHGFQSGPGNSVSTGIRDAYLWNNHFNIIVVDWSSGASTPNYITARNRVSQVADTLARFINFLVTNGLSQRSQINIAGHSLGAHIAGIAGKRVLGGRIQAIFGLDPAAPLFALNEPNDRIALNDAVYTEVIHTNAGNQGFAEPIAQADFYPNWGSSQPGCGVDVSGSCAHSRAHHLFAESINSNRFVSRRCVNYQEIVSRICTGTGTASMGGEPGNVGLLGVFFLETNSNSPFARG